MSSGTLRDTSDTPPSGARRQLPRIGVFVAVGALLALLTYGLATGAPDTGLDQRLARREAAPSPGFRLTVLERGDVGSRMRAAVEPAMRDGQLTGAELEGTPFVLNFWASWCNPCRVEAPRLERAWRAARARGVLFVGLNQQDLSGDAREFLREFDASYPNVRDPSNDTAIEWGVTGLPETFFVTARGNVVGHVVGAISDRQLRLGIEAAVSGRVIGVISGGVRQATR